MKANEMAEWQQPTPATITSSNINWACNATQWTWLDAWVVLSRTESVIKSLPPTRHPASFLEIAWNRTCSQKFGERKSLRSPYFQSFFRKLQCCVIHTKSTASSNRNWTFLKFLVILGWSKLYRARDNAFSVFDIDLCSEPVESERKMPRKVNNSEYDRQMIRPPSAVQWRSAIVAPNIRL